MFRLPIGCLVLVVGACSTTTISGSTTASVAGSATGASVTGGSVTGGSASGGSATGGSATGGSATGGSTSGGSASGSSGGTAGCQTPLVLSGYLLTVDAGEPLFPAYDLRAGDINRDGISDLVELNVPNAGGGPTLGWSFGLSDGGFADFQYLDLSGITGNFSSNTRIVVADFNNDGFADAILTYANGEQQLRAELFGGSASGLADTGPIWNSSSDMPTISGVGVGDVNGDGWQDLVVGGVEISVVLNLTDGGFLQVAAIANPPPGFPDVRFAIVDLNGDGLPDILVPGNPIVGGWSTQVTYQQSDGGFSDWIALAGDPGSASVATYGSAAVVSAPAQIGLVAATSDGGLCGDLSPAITPSPGFVQSAAIDLNHDAQLDVVSLGTSSLVSFLATPTGWDPVSPVALPAQGEALNLVVLIDGRIAVTDPADERILIFDNGCGE